MSYVYYYIFHLATSKNTNICSIGVCNMIIFLTKFVLNHKIYTSDTALKYFKNNFWILLKGCRNILKYFTNIFLVEKFTFIKYFPLIFSKYKTLNFNIDEECPSLSIDSMSVCYPLIAGLTTEVPQETPIVGNQTTDLKT